MKLKKLAKTYGAVCTPDFFGYNSNLELQYQRKNYRELKELKPVRSGDSDLVKCNANGGTNWQRSGRSSPEHGL